MVKRLVKDPEAILSNTNERDCHLVHMALGIAGEAGELVDAIKKHTIYQKTLDIENVIEELGDLEFYMEGLRSALKITRDETLKANIKKLSKRYKNFRYTDKQAINRKDKKKV